MITLIVLLFAGLLLLVLGLFSRRRIFPSIPVDQLATKIRAVDIEAFRNLVDPDEEHFLVNRLVLCDSRSYVSH